MIMEYFDFYLATKGISFIRVSDSKVLSRTAIWYKHKDSEIELELLVTGKHKDYHFLDKPDWDRGHYTAVENEQERIRPNKYPPVTKKHNIQWTSS